MNYIMTQNGKNIVPMNDIIWIRKIYGSEDYNIVYGKDFTIGTYKNEECAKNVLFNIMCSVNQDYKVFRMPKD